MVELLKQQQFAPFPVEQQVVSIWAGTTGALDDIPVADIHRFEADFLDHLGRDKPEIYAGILETGKLEDDNIEALQKAIEEFKKAFDSREKTAEVNEAEAEAARKEDEARESVKVRRPKPPSK